MAANMFTSAKLTYRAIEDTPGDFDFLHSISQDVEGFANSNTGTLKPQSKEDTKRWKGHLTKACLLGVLICLTTPAQSTTSRTPAPSSDASWFKSSGRPPDPQHEQSKSKTSSSITAAAQAHFEPPAQGSSNNDNINIMLPIGVLALSGTTTAKCHHRSAFISIDIHPAYQGKGYGSEAIRWVLEWGFAYQGLHRIGIESFSHNEGAGRLYERLGFVLEGRQRQALWFRGGWSDELMFGMLEEEWRERARASHAV